MARQKMTPLEDGVANQWSRWRDIPASILSDSVGRFGAMAGAMRSLTGQRVVGPAFPVRTMPGDSRTLHVSLLSAPPGSVLVVDAGGLVDRAVWGEVLTHSARAAHVIGAVIDGAVRDIAGIRAMNFPLFALGTAPAGPHKAGGGTIGEPISCGGVVVAPGDLVIGDDDGVAVAHGVDLDDLYHSVNQRMELERGWITRISGGEPSAVVLGFAEASAEKER